jgi:hypothetical protein
MTEAQLEKRQLARARVRARIQRVAMIRRRFTAAALTVFAISWGFVFAQFQGASSNAKSTAANTKSSQTTASATDSAPSSSDSAQSATYSAPSSSYSAPAPSPTPLVTSQS